MRVVGERLESLGDSALLLRERRRELVRLERPARREAGAVPEEARAAHGESLAVGDGVEELGAAGVDQPDAPADELERARDSGSGRSATARR